MIPELETQDLVLRGLRLEDAPEYARHFNDYEVIRHLSAKVPWPYPEDGVLSFLQQILPRQGVDRWDWGLFLKGDEAGPIGSLGLWRVGCPEHRGFWLGRRYWGRGLMAQAVEATTQLAFEQLGFERLVLSNAAGNARSRRLKERSGATLLGVRPAQFVDPSYHESQLWELTRERWLTRRAEGQQADAQAPQAPQAPRVQIIALDPEGWARQRALRLRALQESPDAFSARQIDEQAHAESLWRGRLQRALATLVAVLDGQDVGLAVLAEAHTGQAGDVGLYGVWVDPRVRGRGVGRALIQAAVAAARQDGRSRVVLDVGDQNLPAIGLYARMGFRPTGRATTLPPPREHITEHERALTL